ncbi:MAG: RNA polymerase sigma factor [Victivallales bacterium]|nr:RNA polymerase sigma factor [Victivallales bacterium]
MQKQTDAGIVAEILAGNIEAYVLLMDKYRKTVSLIAAKRIPAENVEAVIHEIFVQIYQSLDKYSGKAPFGNWAARIAIRTCYNYWRQKYRQRKFIAATPVNEDQHHWLERISGDDKAENEAEIRSRQQDAVKLSQWLLRQLSPENRTLIESIYFDEMPLKEVAAILEWSLAKTKVRAMRARKEMRKLLESIGESI